MTKTCDPDLVANPTVVDDPFSDAPAPGQVLSWECCGAEYVFAPSTRRESESTRAAWHFVARTLTPV